MSVDLALGANCGMIRLPHEVAGSCATSMSRASCVNDLSKPAFELNSLAWRRPLLRHLLSLSTYPLAILRGYIDTCQRRTNGNSFLVVAPAGVPVPSFNRRLTRLCRSHAELA